MKTIKNAIRLMREFSDAAPKLGVSELSRRLNLDPATVHRMLRTLCNDHLIEQEPDSKLYRLGPGLLHIAQGFLRQYGMGEIAKHHLESLRDKTEETVGLKIQQGRNTICIASAEGRHPVRVSFYAGEQSPLHCTSTGIIYLSHMSDEARSAALSGKLKKFTPRTVTDLRKINEMIQDARNKGVSFSDSTYLDGVRSVSAPIIGKNGDLYAVVTIIVPCQRMPAKHLAKFIQPLKSTAEAIANDIDRLGTVRGMPKSK